MSDDQVGHQKIGVKKLKCHGMVTHYNIVSLHSTQTAVK